jgi:hypothetical protein
MIKSTNAAAAQAHSSTNNFISCSLFSPSLPANRVAMIKPPVVEIGLTPVMVPPTMTMEPSSIGLTPSYGAGYAGYGRQ